MLSAWNRYLMSAVKAMSLLFTVLAFTLLGLVSSAAVEDLHKRQGQLYSLMVVAPPENISPAAGEIAASLAGKVHTPPRLQHLMLVSLQSMGRKYLPSPGTGKCKRTNLHGYMAGRVSSFPGNPLLLRPSASVLEPDRSHS